MGTETRKYLVQSNEHPYPHMGHMMLRQMAMARLNMSDTAKGLDVSPTGVLRYSRQASLQAGLVWKLGLVFRHNMLADIAAAFPIAPVADAPLLERIKDLEKELAIYKSIVLAGK